MRHFAIVFLCVFGLASSYKILDNDDGVPPQYEPGMIPEGPEFEEGQRDSDWMSWAGEFEGDIKLTESQLRQLNDSSSERNGLVDKTARWPEGKIPYVITEGDFSSAEMKIIKRAFASYTKYTCIRMVERTTEEDYIAIVRRVGCWSYVGRVGGKQKMSLEVGCVTHATVIHEFMHTVGFDHEQSRADRDTYIKILYENIEKRDRKQFKKCSAKTTSAYGEPYDYQSVMHYGAYFCSKNGKKTMQRLDGSRVKIGNEVGFSQMDVNKINKMYECDTTSVACEDKSKYEDKCPKWADEGDCARRKHSEFMALNCRKSCGMAC